MAHRLKHDKFHFNFSVLLRLFIFFVIVYFLVVSLSSSGNSRFVLGDSIQVKPVVDDLYYKIPSSSRQKIENFSSNPAVISLQQKIKLLQEETNGFPQKQITDIKKAVVQQIYDSVMKSIK